MPKQTAGSFWRRVKKTRHCWGWRGACNSTGYGTVSWHGRVYTAHRLAAWLLGLVISPSAPKNPREPTHVLHTCDNRHCCNPAHFFLGTYSDNQKDAYRKRRKVQPKGQKHTNAKLTNRQAKRIRVLYTQGRTQTALAITYGVNQTSISKIVRGVTYDTTL